MVINPVITQTAISQPAEPTFLVISALTIKIPEPIIEPATIIVESNKPNDCLKEAFCSAMNYRLGFKISNSGHFIMQLKQNVLRLREDVLCLANRLFLLRFIMLVQFFYHFSRDIINRIFIIE